ncbi:MAG: tRNA (adenosine(37)-N6)-dimethylallyltransferase MiaA [Alphaproteobacteria bacterium]
MADKGRDVGHEARRDEDAVLIAGPTASGKSALAQSLAERTGGVIINADSMQVYVDLRIITARPTIEEEARADHLLFGTVDGAVNFSVGHWLRAVTELIATLRAENKLAILVGGTGLYFKALTQGLSAIPAVSADIRDRLRAETEGLAPEAIHARLAKIDPRAAEKLRPSDPQRCLRALEVMVATGRSLLDWQGETRVPPLLDVTRCVAVFLSVERPLLRERINRRFEAMMESGAMDEVMALKARGLDPALPVMRAHGVPGLIAYREGQLSLAEAIAKGQADTRAYAKRQETWFRHQLAGFEALSPEAAASRLSHIKPQR